MNSRFLGLVNPFRLRSNLPFISKSKGSSTFQNFFSKLNRSRKNSLLLALGIATAAHTVYPPGVFGLGHSDSSTYIIITN